MTRTNPEKLSVKYPVVKFIKKRMKRNDNFTENHVKGFDRRVRDHDLMMFMIEYTQELYEKAHRKETREEGRLADTVSANHYTIQNLQKQVAELQMENEDLILQLDHYKCYD